MIRIVRLRRIDSDRPAGEVFDFKFSYDAGIFLIGKDMTNYLVFKNGFELTFDDYSVDKIIQKIQEA